MRKTIWVILVVVVIALAWWGIASKDAKQASGEPIKIGVIAGTTGQYASAGEGYLKGFTLAQEEWNKTNDSKFNAVVEDDGFDANKGLTAYHKLKEASSVDAYAILSTFTMDAIYNDVSKLGKPVALGFEQSIPASADNVFQVLPAARPVQKRLGEHLKELGYKKPIAVVSDNTSVYQNFYEGFEEGYGNAAKANINADQALARTQATKILAAKPDIIVFFAAPKDGANLVKELLLQSGGKLPKLAFDQSIQSGASDYKAILGSSLSKINGSIVALSRNDLTEQFKLAFKNKYQIDPPFGADMGYNAFMLLATSYDPSSSNWVRNMEKGFQGADGEVKFDENGLRLPNVYFAETKDGEVIVK